MSTMIVLRLDGEIWECKPGIDRDDNTIANVVPIPAASVLPTDRAARAKGITHRQHGHHGIKGEPCHELKRLYL